MSEKIQRFEIWETIGIGRGPVGLEPIFAKMNKMLTNDEEEESRPWRGVCALDYNDEIIFTKQINVQPEFLEEYEPNVVIDRRHFDEETES